MTVYISRLPEHETDSHDSGFAKVFIFAALTVKQVKKIKT